MASPPKPWERAGAGPVPSLTIPSSPASSSAAPLSPASSVASMDAPPIPERPASLAASINQNAAAHTRVGAMGAMGAMGGMGGMGAIGAMGASPYGSYNSAYSSPYSSPYSRFGGGYGGYGGGGGMYGSGYGGMGGMYGGGMYGGGMMGDPNSLANRFSNGTAATFQMLEGVVTAFGGFAQMLESTYMATHSSFFAMISVAEQFGNLRDTLGSLLGIFTLLRWIRTLLAKLTGRPLPADAASLTPSDFALFQGRSGSPGGSSQPPKASRKPLLFFLLAAFGIPYLMSKVIKSISANAEEEERRLEQQALEAQKPVDPANLEFCRIRFDFNPQQPNGMELEGRKGDLVAVLSKNDPAGQPSEWWHCRSRDGRQGYLPSTYLEVLKRSTSEPKKLKAAPDSRTNSLTSSSATEEGKKEYATADGMQRSHFYS